MTLSDSQLIAAKARAEAWFRDGSEVALTRDNAINEEEQCDAPQRQTQAGDRVMLTDDRETELAECLRVALMRCIQHSGNRVWGAAEADDRKRCITALMRFGEGLADNLVPAELQHVPPGNGRKA